LRRISEVIEQFLRERTYINNVTASTRERYQCARKAFNAAQPFAEPRAIGRRVMTQSAGNY
jgi:hypothetical protein